MAPEDFKIERLKHILKQQEILNEHSHKYLSFYQTIATTIILSMVMVFISWRQLSIAPTLAKAAIRSLELTLMSTGLFFIIVIITNIIAWLDYRREETEILNSEINGFRKMPSIRSLWKWFEFWFIMLVIFFTASSLYFVEYFCISVIQ